MSSRFPSIPVVLVLALIGLAAPTTVAAQAILGTVIEESSGQSLEGVRVVLLDEAEELMGETYTDEAGHFQLEVPYGGSWRIRASLIGYGDVASEPLELEIMERVALEVRMTVEAVPIEEPVVVTSRMAPMNADLRSFYDRAERGGRSGFGTFITRDDVDRIRPLETTDLLRAAGGIRVVRGRPGRGRLLYMAGGCVPAIYIDGAFINRWDTGDSLDDYVSPNSIEGIEVYRGLGQVGRFHDPRGCGLVLVWTRRGAPPTEGSRSWLRYAAGLSLLLGILLLR